MFSIRRLAKYELKQSPQEKRSGPRYSIGDGASQLPKKKNLKGVSMFRRETMEVPKDWSSVLLFDGRQIVIQMFWR